MKENKLNQTCLLLSWKKVPKGTNGGVSPIGTLASAMGGFFIGLAFYLSFRLSFALSNQSVISPCKKNYLHFFFIFLFY